MSDLVILIYNTTDKVAYFVRSLVPVLEVGQAAEFADHPKYYGIIQQLTCAGAGITIDSTTITLTIDDSGNVANKTIKLPLAFTFLIQGAYNLSPP